MSTDDTGVGLLVYNRPEHTRKVLDGLKENDIDHLYVFADGPDENADREKISATREVVRDIEFCEVELYEADNNLGLQNSWKRAYDTIFELHEKAIMLEDDCVPSNDFIHYMQSCLDRYESEERVMNVHGYTPPIDIPSSYEYDVYFTWRSGSWGQGTWKSAWEELDRDPAILSHIKQDSTLRQRVERAGWDLVPMLKKELNDEIDSIGVWWSLTLVMNNGVSVNPVESRIMNIGHDGSGTHSSSTDRFKTDMKLNRDREELSFPPEIKVDDKINKGYNYHIGGKLRGKIGRKIEQLRMQLPF
jgi:hypothetical protein